jgi:hypothetical protein
LTVPRITPILRNQAVSATPVYELQQFCKWLRDDNFAAPTISLGAAAVEGVATTWLRSDAVIVAFDATAPTTIAPDDAAATGNAAVAARRDHVHAIVTAAATGLTVASTSAEGDATSFARSNHTHAITTSSNSGAAAAILASNASGGVRLTRIGIAVADNATYPLDVTGDGRLTGGLNVGSATEAAAGQIRSYAGYARTYITPGTSVASPSRETALSYEPTDANGFPYITFCNGFLSVHDAWMEFYTRTGAPAVVKALSLQGGNLSTPGGINVGSATEAAAGEIDMYTSLKYRNTKVVGAQGASIADATTDTTSLRDTVNAIISRLEAHGLIAT